MKKQFNFKSMYRAALVAMSLMTVGVGNAWAGTKRIYAEYSAVSSWWGNDDRNSIPYIYAWGGNHDAKKYTMTATGTSNLAYCDIDDYHTDLLFYRSTTESGSWDNQTVDVSIGSNNRWSILDSETDGKKNVGSAQRWTPTAAIDGLLDPKNPHNQAFVDGEFTATLEARKTYEFKIIDGTTLYGLNDNVWTSSVSEYTLKSGEYQIRLCTAGAGTYTFTWDDTNKKLSVAYPSVSHPNKDYCYIINYNWSPSTNFNPWNCSSTKVGEWNGESTIQGVIGSGTSLYNTTTIYGQSYFYIAAGEYANFVVTKNNDPNDRTGDVATADGYGKRRYYNNTSWVWDTIQVHIALNDLSATTHVSPNHMDVAFLSEVLTDLTTVPEKTHYDFGGFYTGYDEDNDVATGTQVINSEGEWIASVAGYTDADKHWIHDGTSTTLYAMWTEHEYALTINISPVGAGTVSPSPTTVKYVTPTALLTATPTNAAYIFKEWQYSTNVGPYGETGNDNTVQITAAQNGTLTAVFQPRYTLVGSLAEDGDPAGGMPGWTDPEADAKAFTINSISPSIDMTKTCTLNPNSTYKFEIHDRKAGENYGYGEGTSVISGSQQFNTKDRTVILLTKGRGEYTFTISAISESGGKYYPTVSVSGPTSYQMNLSWADVDIDGNWWKTSRATGGTVAAVATESGNSTTITNGQYVAAGGSITYTATPATGYTFGGWWNGGDWNTKFSDTNPYTSSSISATEDVEGKFIETSTSVTLSNDGHGKVQIGGVDKTSTTCGVTTTRELTAVPNEGYKFSSWSKSGDDITLSSTTTNPTTLSGNGSGATSGQTVTANFDYRWIVQPEKDEGEWGYAYFTIEHIEEVGGKTIGYVDITLAANTNYQFSVVDRDGDVKYKNGSDKVYYMTNGNSHNWEFATDKSNYCGITTAGAGVYRFTWNITDKKMTVTYPNFIIYRTGDKAGDERATEDDVESYAGGTIAKAIEFRMRVNRLDKWYTLCLPFTVTAVKVWDEGDGRYYDIVPYWRTGGTYYTGHYIIRTPVSTTDFAIENFDSRDRWVDPSSAASLPSENTPYIIQWHDSWFQDKYISFFSPTGESIPTSMNQGANTSSDETVNIYGNNSMTSGTVQDAYMLDPDYGSGGAWMREEVGTDRTVLPFECFIRANATTTAKYRVLRRDMTIDDTPTGWDTVSETENKTTKVLIDNNIYIIREGRIYTIQGTLVKEGK